MKQRATYEWARMREGGIEGGRECEWQRQWVIRNMRNGTRRKCVAAFCSPAAVRFSSSSVEHNTGGKAIYLDNQTLWRFCYGVELFLGFFMVFVLLQCPAAFHAGSCEAEGGARRWGEKGGGVGAGGKRPQEETTIPSLLLLSSFLPSIPHSLIHSRLPSSPPPLIPASVLRCLLHSYPGRAPFLRCISFIYTSLLVSNCVQVVSKSDFSYLVHNHMKVLSES